ncbi:MAG: dihydrodipicolinate reductase [Alphaproteobacteria bacterium]
MAYKVIQWASGGVGSPAIAAVAGRRNMSLAGLYVYSPEKVGKDAGTIAGVKKTGVIATDDMDKILKTKADVVIHTPLPSVVWGDDPEADLDIICQLLASGKNVITTVGYMYPKFHGPRVVRKLNAACKKGGTTFHSTGSNPGWIGDLLPLTMSSLSNKIDQVAVREISNFQHGEAPVIMFDIMGFGKTRAQFKKDSGRHARWLTELFSESIQMVADGLGVKLDRISTKTTLSLATRNLKTGSGTIKKGTVAAQRWEWAGWVGRKKVITHETIWRMHEAAAKDWPDGDHSVSIIGEPNIRIEIAGDWVDSMLDATALHAVNAIPHVCKAEPGIKTFLDLPWIMGKGLVHISKNKTAKA